ncbi:hypothetical protein ACN6MT_26255 [Neobacillus niacini]|uniref:hypothetical protein n=1 Tax=Neobacillus niacini TaxID=86668 RepID=UPI003B02C81E
MRRNTNDNTAIALLRQEFSFYVNEAELDRVLGFIADEGVTLIAFTITTMDKGDVYFVRMIVGPNNCNSSFANKVAREALHSVCIRYHEKEVIQIIISEPSPGFGRKILQALCPLRLFATYTGDNSLILNLSDNRTALKLLREANII